MNTNKMIKVITAIILSSVAINAFADQVCETATVPQTTPNSRFTINDDATVLDTHTGLIWKRCSQGQTGNDCQGAASTFGWQEALNAGKNESFAGETDWRVPNVKELSSIIEYGCMQPTINLSVFPNTSMTSYWSGTPDTEPPFFFTLSWSVGFDFGTIQNGFRDSEYPVRLVRGD